MVDGIDEYRGREFDWAIETVLYNAREMGQFEETPDAKSLVDDVWDFILEVFVEERIQPPDRSKLIDAVHAQIPEEQERRKRPPRHVASLSPDQVKMHNVLEKLRQESYAAEAKRKPKPKPKP